MVQLLFTFQLTTFLTERNQLIKNGKLMIHQTLKQNTDVQKRLGEEAVEKYTDRFYIIRTAWVFGNYGKNFVFTMQNLAKTHDTLTVVNDQHGRPTWTRTLADL